MLSLKFKKKVRGSILLYTLFFSFLIASICSFFIFKHYTTQKIDFEYDDFKRSYLASISILNKYQKYSPSKMGVIQKEKFNAKDVFFIKRHWGAFDQLNTKVISKKKTIHKGGFYGNFLNRKKNRLAISLQNQKADILLVGKTKIKGNVSLKNGAIKTAFIEGKSFTGKKLIDGLVIKNIDLKENQLSKSNLSTISSSLKGLFDYDSTIQLLPNQKRQENSFFDKTIVLKGKEVYLNKLDLEGNIIIYATNLIELDSTCYLENVLLFAPKIIIKSGVKGIFQAFARDTLLVEKNVSLDYPSTIGIVSKTGQSLIEIDSNFSLSGSIIHQSKNQKGKTIMKGNTNLNGAIIDNSNLMFNGEISGKIIAEKFYYKTSSRVYYNHLIDATIDATKLPNEAAFFSNNNETLEKKLMLCVK